MNSGNFEIIAVVLSGLGLIFSITALLFSTKLRRWRKTFDPENQPDNLEEVLSSITEMVKKLKGDQTALTNTVSQIEETLQTAFQYSSVVRFDSGSSDGGNLSFALALLNGQQTGIIVTSLHGRQHNRIYCKAIQNGQSLHALNEEEQQALIEALTDKSKLARQNKIDKESNKK